MTADALAWMALLVDGRIVRGQGNADVWTLARDAGWVEATGRRDELRLVEPHRLDVEARLDRLWPHWRVDLEALMAAGLSPTRRGWQALQEKQRRDRLPSALPGALNRRTAAAALRDHAKARVEGDAFDGTVLTHDNVLRLRPHRGLVLERGQERLDGASVASMCGEVCVSERALDAGTCLAGSKPRAVLLIENIGVYVDLQLPDDWCAVHVPGWNTRMVERARDFWPGSPAAIFGDLDPNGVAIARSLRGVWPDLEWFVPSFALAYLERGHPKTWPVLATEVPAVIHELAERGVWLEQEVFLFDPRLLSELLTWGSRHRGHGQPRSRFT